MPDFVLLDTHVWVWVVEGQARRVGRKTRQMIARAERQSALRISPVSCFEVAALHTVGRLRLDRPAASWIREALDPAGGRVASLSVEAAVDAGLIPGTALGDSLDRLLVATTRAAGGTLVTADECILDCARESAALRVHDART